jgi:hypothetical protein
LPYNVQTSPKSHNAPIQAYNHRLVVQLSRLTTHRPTSTTILLRTDEAVGRIPWDIIIKPSPELGHRVCAAIDSALDVVRNVPADQTPYDIYLASGQIGSRPQLRSLKGTVLLS